MKFLTPEIEALLKKVDADANDKSLARTNVSCGIFQDCDYTEDRPKLYHQQKIKKGKD
ncbi:MAG: hypothetical protein WA839_05940 [Flavobacteriaceae bacterium]|tara:strand:- start:854 stop:1027 length:174 start_codon:yes stop_codon:yes gene_type:complete